MMRFLDTNVLAYAIDGRFPDKQRTALDILHQAVIKRNAAVSIQVLTEFSNVAINKLGQTPDEVRQEVMVWSEKLVFIEPSVRHLTRALEIHALCQISIWDALVVAAAEAGGCDTILSEDFNDGQRYCGILAQNPFA